MNSESHKLLQSLPVFAVSGFSGSGKTTLIEALLPGLIRQGLRLAVVKHDAHQLDVDRQGKDSARFFQAGADVYLHSVTEHFSRRHACETPSLTQELLRLSREYDLVFVEGYKHTPLPKVWLLGEKESTPPEDVPGILAVLPWNSDRVGCVSSFLEAWLPQQWLKTPVHACILADQNSLLSQDTKFRGEFVERLTENLAADVRNVLVMTPAPFAEAHPHLLLPSNDACAWPMSAVLAAMRCDPFAAFLMVHDDDCTRTAAVARKMLALRRPGCRAIFAEKDAGGAFPLPAYFDFRFLPVLETMAFGNGDFLDVYLQPNIAIVH